MKPKDTSQNDVQVFSSTDDRLKTLGEILGNSTSRTILTLLLEKEMTIMQISKESKISANLVMYHLKKLVHSDVVTITKQSKNSRGHPLRFYRAKPAIVILTKDAAYRANKNKSFWNVFGRITRFSAIGLAGAFTWFITNSHLALESAFKYPRPTLPPYMSPIEPQTEPLIPVILTCGMITLGLLINHYVPKIKSQHING